MALSDEAPQLQITYSPDFVLQYQLLAAERTASVGYVSWRFALTCTIQHPTGEFRYHADDISVPLDAFQSFYDELNKIAAGTAHVAELRDDDRMACFAVTLEGRRLKASIRIEEYQPCGELTVLTAGFEVDYDLFVNKLRDEVRDFIKEVQQVDPQNI